MHTQLFIIHLIYAHVVIYPYMAIMYKCSNLSIYYIHVYMYSNLSMFSVHVVIYPDYTRGYLLSDTSICK